MEVKGPKCHCCRVGRRRRLGLFERVVVALCKSVVQVDGLAFERQLVRLRFRTVPALGRKVVRSAGYISATSVI